jgi:hypothetical protein
MNAAAPPTGSGNFRCAIPMKKRGCQGVRYRKPAPDTVFCSRGAGICLRKKSGRPEWPERKRNRNGHCSDEKVAEQGETNGTAIFEKCSRPVLKQRNKNNYSDIIFKWNNSKLN